MNVVRSTSHAAEAFSLADACAKYPGFPKLIALKIDVQRRGVHYTDRALTLVDPARHQTRSPAIFGTRTETLQVLLPDSLLLRDGTSIVVDPAPLAANPYLVDRIDDRLFLVDGGEVLEEVELWHKPAFYDKVTRSGIRMSLIAQARPQRINLFQSSYCYFWANDEGGCRFCDIVTFQKQQRDIFRDRPERPRPADLAETVAEALKEKGRFTTFCLTGGSVLKGEEVFDLEVAQYIETLRAIGRNFATRRFPSQLVASAFNERQLRRLYEETGLSSYTTDLEVLDERLFQWISPGKARVLGYREWRDRLVRAVDIFGRGNVNTGIVGGVDLARPHGRQSEAESLDATLDEAEYLAERGVSVIHTVWVPRPGSAFRDQQAPSLDYYIQLASRLHALRVKYRLRVDFDDYRRCGNHPDTDLARLL
ncbi:Radical SAM protein [Rhodovastum atsumiense]|uniref:Radical SAM protein n=1 Tax=Rhodovastum atsumiense TaxID=504468 RepID=A0A5M6J0B8_9PROT|nr:radical SAM protein [Rhodovastum atsumiense]KAA5613527.1 radical SAM protein [Rhodovastum atsumiense]CAH2603277.1 Radical SAM protein [Rhodovastum atsumiense]